MVEYCVYWLENGEPMHEVFLFFCTTRDTMSNRGKENIEWVEVSEKEETIDLDELEDMFPNDFSAACNPLG
ncbi:hypothetical protein ACRFA2_22615 (plasmid) [Bacteroides hominis]|uniref:hypothetical protein n=1 Tax=Bacteroides hominis TaxID=2763023 RepID=UPI003D6C7540